MSLETITENIIAAEMALEDAAKQANALRAEIEAKFSFNALQALDAAMARELAAQMYFKSAQRKATFESMGRLTY